MVRQVGWMVGEFSQFPKYTRENIERIVILDGFENFDAARRRGKGVLFLTGRHGAQWEPGSLSRTRSTVIRSISWYARSPTGGSMRSSMVTVADRAIGQSIRTASRARSLKVLGDSGTVGILMDHNAIPEESVFVDFFGIPASTSSGLARVALRTDAAVVPGFLSWDEGRRKYRLRFHPAVELIRTGNEESDVLENTALLTRVIEDHIRPYPDQWLWLHKRWKTRPAGEEPLYR